MKKTKTILLLFITILYLPVLGQNQSIQSTTSPISFEEEFQDHNAAFATRKIKNTFWYIDPSQKASIADIIAQQAT